MTPAANPNSAEWSISSLFDPVTITVILHDVLSGEQGRNRPVKRVRVERCWPGRRGEFVFEWSFALGRARHCALFGRIPARPRAAGKQKPRPAPIIGGRLCGVSRYFPERKLLVHSPDCDPAMPHLAECLDARRMAAHLRPLWGRKGGRQASSATGVECKALGYRSGKRAVIGYRPLRSRRLSDRFLGKTFRDGRAERLAEIHRQLNEQLAWHSQGRVRVPAPVAHLPDLYMTLFSWVAGKRSTGKVMAPGGGAWTAVDTLAALHRTSIDGLPAFAVADECEIVNHWHVALQRVEPSWAAATAPLLGGLLKTAGMVEPTPQCTIHRDFYDRQLIVGRRTTTLLDLDTLAWGPSAVDLGNLLAHVHLGALETGRSQREYDLFSRELVSRYEQQMGPVDHRALAFFWATALFRVGAVHALRTATRQHAPAMWACAERVLEGSTARPRAHAWGSVGVKTARTLRRRKKRLATRGLA